MTTQSTTDRGMFARRVFFILLAASSIACFSTRAMADAASQTAINGSSAQLSTLGLPLVPTGNNAAVGVLEVADGIPQLNPPNANMPVAGPGAGQINIIAGATPSDHATFVPGIIMQQTPGGPPHAGIAPNSTLTHAGASTFHQILTRSQTLVSSSPGGFNADVLNWSWHRTGPPGSPSNGSALETRWLDWAVIPGTGSVPVKDFIGVVAGNESASNTRFSPWDNYNGITVGATSTNNYKQLATYNGVAGAGVGTRNVTTDASPYGNGRVGRFKTDIVAPGGGDGVVMASPVLRGGALDANNDGLNDNGAWGGTSFAAPHVSGAAAMMYEFGRAQNFSTNELAIKALLLNGADKQGLTDHNGAYQAEGLQAQTKTGMGGANQPIFIGWDGDLGTGLLDAGESLLQYNAGEHGPGVIPHVGWDLETVGLSGPGITTQQYTFAPSAAGIFQITATLAWNRLINLGDIAQTGFVNGEWDSEDLNMNGVLDMGEDVDGDGLLDVETLNALTLNDLDLEIWNTTLNQRVYFSSSDMDSIEHVDFDVPGAMRFDTFELRVAQFHRFGPTDDLYGLAWTAVVPEPSSVLLSGIAIVGIAGIVWRRKRSPATQGTRIG